MSGKDGTVNKGEEMEKLKARIDSLSEELLMAYEELNLFYDLGNSMWSLPDSEGKLEFILRKALEIIEADKAAVLVFDEFENRLSIRKGLASGRWISVDHANEIEPEGTVLSRIIRAKPGMIINDITKAGKDLSPLIATKSLLGVSLYIKDKVIGALTVGDRQGREFTSNDLKLATVLSSQAVLIIDNDRLFRENTALAEIGRIISSTLNVDEVYERFAGEVEKLIPFSRITINLIDDEKNRCKRAYNAGSVPAGRKGEFFPLPGSATEEVMRTRTGVVFHPEGEKEVTDRFPGLVPSFEAGHRSMMVVPLISNDRVIGSMYFGSVKPRAYTTRDLRLAVGVGSQIAGAIANAQLFIEHKQAEEEKRALEEQFLQAQKMEAVGQLAGGIAHDFNNLLTVIKGYSELSLASLPSDDPLRGSIEAIERASERAAELTRRLLAFSRRQVMELKVIDLGTIVRNLEKMLRRVIGENIELIIGLQENLGRVRVDSGQMEQVILNLAINAKDVMPQGGKLMIGIKNSELDEAYASRHIGVQPGRYVTLSVSDTGRGMAPEVRERIFEPFFTTKEKGKGTGLGLSTVYGIVKQSGGNIRVYSELGHGTVFEIYLPQVDEAADESEEEAGVEEAPRGDETILLAEDEGAVRNLAAEYLRGQGYTVLEAPDGREASAACSGHDGSIDLLVTDVVMPGMSGRELAEKLGSMRPEMKVLYMSGYTDDSIIHHGVLGEGVSFIQKPFSVVKLARKVREVLDKG